MGKIAQGMSKGYIGYGVGVASLILSGYLVISSEKDLEKVEAENSKLNVVLEEKFEVIEEYKLKQLDLEDDIKSYKILTEELSERFDEVQKEGLKIKSENEKIKLEIEKAKKEKADWVSYIQTHYTSYCNTGCTGKTATGHKVNSKITHDGYSIIAVDPKRIPLGSIVEINDGVNKFKAIALDTGGSIKGNKIDLLVSVNDSNYAYSLGVKDIKLKMLRKGWG